MKVYIICIGPGSEDYLIPIARDQIERADCLVGASRLVSLFHKLGKEEIFIEGNLNKIISYLKRYKDKKKIAVLVSGDPGIYSLLEKVSKVLNHDEYIVIPGISTVQLAFARIGHSWSDAKIVSLHGRKIHNLIEEISSYNKIFLYTDADFPPNKIARYLLKMGMENRRAVVLENLSYPNEKILDTDLKHLVKKKRFGLCAMIIENYPSTNKKGKLYGVGIGPGDPKLVTLKARQILDKADVIFVPKGRQDGSSWARLIVEDIVTTDKKFIELTFPMTKDRSILNKYWMDAARLVVNQINKKKIAAFVTIGDPFIYSTYVYLLRTLQKYFPQIQIETVPGISTFTAAASTVNLPLVEANQRLAVVPVTKNLYGLRQVLLEFDTVVLMKVGSKLDKVISLLEELGLLKHAVLISRVGHKDEKIIYNLASLQGKRIGYLSVIMVKK